MHATRNKILQALADGEFVSGTDLGEISAISRTAVAKHIDALRGFGLDIFSVKGRGYKLASPIDLLNIESISQSYFKLNHSYYPGTCYIEPIIDSTNTYLKEKLAHGELADSDVCLAESQTAGRGRQGKAWVSPFASSIYMSVYRRFSGGYQTISGLSLVIGLAVADCLDELGISGVQLKWPNDVYVNMQKIAGILIEIEGAVGDLVDSIIGIGINVSIPDDVSGIDQAFTDCNAHVPSPVKRNELIALLLNYINKHLDSFVVQGLVPFMDSWQSKDVFYNKPIKLLAGQSVIEGIGMGINETGAILLQVDGELKAFHGGEISVRGS